MAAATLSAGALESVNAACVKARARRQRAEETEGHGAEARAHVEDTGSGRSGRQESGADELAHRRRALLQVPRGRRTRAARRGSSSRR